MDSFAVSVFFQSGLYHGTLCASFLTNFHFVTSSLARWRCQSGSTLWRPTTGLFSNSLSSAQSHWTVVYRKELAPYDEDRFYVRTASMARHMYIRLGLILYVFVPLIEAKQSRVFCWVIMWATVFSPNNTGLVKIVPFWATQGENNTTYRMVF